MHDFLERVYAAGDHRTARAVATQISAQSRGDIASHDPHRRLMGRDAQAQAAQVPAPDPSCVARAQAILTQTTPDFFLPGIGAAGLGLVTWLVYNYVL